jgi:hypothetical protein
VRGAKFENVAHESMKVPIGMWPRKPELVGGGTPLFSVCVFACLTGAVESDMC